MVARNFTFFTMTSKKLASLDLFWGNYKEPEAHPPNHNQFNVLDQMDLSSMDSSGSCPSSTSSSTNNRQNLTATTGNPPAQTLEFPLETYEGKETVSFYAMSIVDLERLLCPSNSDLAVKNEYSSLQWRLILCNIGYEESTFPEHLCKVYSVLASSTTFTNESSSQDAQTIRKYIFQGSQLQSSDQSTYENLQKTWEKFTRNKEAQHLQQRLEKAAFLLNCQSNSFQCGQLSCRLTYKNGSDLPSITDTFDEASSIPDRDSRIETLTSMITATASFDVLAENPMIKTGPLSYGGIPLIAIILAPNSSIVDNSSLGRTLISKLSSIKQPTKKKIMTAAGWLLGYGAKKPLSDIINAVPSATITLDDIKSFATEAKNSKIALFNTVEGEGIKLVSTNFITTSSRIGPPEILSIMEDSVKILVNGDQIGILDNPQVLDPQIINQAITSLIETSFSRYIKVQDTVSSTASITQGRHKDRLMASLPKRSSFSHVLITGLPQSLIKDNQKLEELLTDIFTAETWANITISEIRSTIANLSQTTIDFGAGRHGVITQSSRNGTSPAPIVMGFTGQGKDTKKFKFLLQPLTGTQADLLSNRTYQTMSTWRNLGTSSANILKAKLTIDAFLSKLLGPNGLSIVNLFVHGVAPAPSAKPQTSATEGNNNNNNPNNPKKGKYTKVEELCLICYSPSQQQATYARSILGISNASSSSSAKPSIIELSSWKFEVHAEISNFSNARMADPDLMKVAQNVIAIETPATITPEEALGTFASIADFDCFRMIIPPCSAWEWEPCIWMAIMSSSWSINNVTQDTLNQLRSENTILSHKPSIHKYILSSQLFNGPTVKPARPLPLKAYDPWFNPMEHKITGRQRPNKLANDSPTHFPSVALTLNNSNHSYSKAVTTNLVDFSQVGKLLGKLEENSSLVGKLVADNQNMTKKVDELSAKVTNMQRNNDKSNKASEANFDQRIVEIVMNAMDVRFNEMNNAEDDDLDDVNQVDPDTRSPPSSKPRTK